MRLGRPALIAVLALLAAGLLAAPATGKPGRLLDKSTDSGFASAFVTGGARDPKAFIVRARALPNERVEVRWDISCARGRSGKTAIGEFTMSGKGKHRLKLPVKNSPDCIANALVGYEDTGVTGKLRVELFVR